MRFTAAALISSALALAPSALGQDDSFYPPGGLGILRVSLAGESEFTGCLTERGKWTLADQNCAEVFGNGQGGIISKSGWLALNSNSMISNVVNWLGTFWVGTHENQGRNTSNLVANPGVEDDDWEPHGGPVWYAAAIPSGDGVEDVGGRRTEGAQGINLFFEATD